MQRILNANCKSLPITILDAADVLITDPPYSNYVHTRATSNRTGGAGVVKRDLGFDHLQEDLIRTISFIASRVLRWSIIFADFDTAIKVWEPRIGKQIRMTPEVYEDVCVHTLPWIRWSQPQLSGDRPPTGAEAVCHFHGPGKKHWNGPGNLTHYSNKSLRGRDKHPTEKPLGLMLDIVSWFSDPGELILDPCAGRGTTGQAARLLERRCIMSEVDAEECDKAHKRLSTPLSERDREQAARWIRETLDACNSVPAPKAKDGSDVKTYERAMRRKEDAKRVARFL